MAYNENSGLPRDTVRLLIADTDTTPVFTDGQVDQFLALEAGSVFAGAALALETIAVNEALVLKVIQTLDLKTDGAKLAAELRARAKDLRARADDDQADIDDDFAVAEFADPVFGYRDVLDRSYYRA